VGVDNSVFVYILLPSNTHCLIISKVKQQMDEKVMFLSATLTHGADTGYGWEIQIDVDNTGVTAFCSVFENS